MCGVVGFSGEGGDRQLFISACVQSTIRGIHAFGVAWLDSVCKLHYFKSCSFNEIVTAIPNPFPQKIIFHNRYCTSGDFRHSVNNQPIISDDSKIALVFNGTVDMGTKSEMEARSGYSLNTDNDGELVLNDIIHGNPFLRLHPIHGTSFAGIYLMDGGAMCAFRNNHRPLWQFRHKNGIYITSTQDIARRAGIDISQGEIVEPYKIMNL